MTQANFDGEKWTKVIIIPKREYYRIAEVAIILNTQVPNLYHMIKRGTLKAFLVEGVKMISHDELMKHYNHRRNMSEYR